MSKLSQFDDKKTSVAKRTKVENFMGGVSYTPSALQELKLIANSSIFGEPSYYRPSKISNGSYLAKFDIFYKDSKLDTTEAIFEAAIDKALDANFAATLEYAVELRNTLNMRLNPAVIMVRALMHPDRAEFNAANPGVLNGVMAEILNRPDDITNQLEYFLYLNKSKNGLPTIAKRAWGKYLSSLTAYQIAKYKEGAKIIDLVRITHAKSSLIDELMKTGSVVTTDEEKTWENFKAAGKTWAEILALTYVPHMALLRNLRNIFTEITDIENVKNILKQLQDGVAKGKQFPFRYYSAYKMLEKESLENKSVILDGINTCIEIAIENNAKMQGKTISLCDNSGSSWGALTTSHPSGKTMNGTAVAEIANLSGIITAKNSDDGYVGVFGDRLQIIPVVKTDSVFSQLNAAITAGRKQGGSTENGLWIFFRDAIKNKDHWDNVFIYSDMQAGHGGLYGVNPDEYAGFKYGGSRYIDLMALVNKYRKEVNPKVNIITVQVAGYNNSVIPENLYRGAILSGWTGKETDFAFNMNKIWNEIEGISPDLAVSEKIEIKKPVKKTSKKQ